MDYSDWLSKILTFLEIADPSGVTAFAAVETMIIAIAEGRLYRDPSLDFLATRVTDTSQLTAAGSRSVAIPSEFLTLEGITIVTPANTAPYAGTRIPYLRTDRPFIDMTWPVEAQTAEPSLFETQYWALFSQEEAQTAADDDEPRALPSAILLAPTPDNSYRVEMTGTQQPAPLSPENPVTFLTQYLPDLFFAGTMVAASAYIQNFGQQSDNPQLALSWEHLYQQLKNDAGILELRKKALVDGYSAMPPRAPTSMEILAAKAQAAGQGG